MFHTPSEQLHIKEFKQFSLNYNIHLDCSDANILRFLYSSEFDYKDCL